MRFFVGMSQIGVRGDGKKTIMIIGDDASHITRSLRMHDGELITACDTNGIEYEAEIIKTTAEAVTAVVVSEKKSESEPPYRAVLYQALIKGDAFDVVIQKAVECGVYAIVPMLCERCTVRLDRNDSLKKAPRWQRIANEAAKQCGRAILPKLMPLMTLKEAVAAASSDDIALFCHFDDSAPLSSVLKNSSAPKTVSILIGPEGGFTPAEAEIARGGDLCAASLGPRVYRSQTASSIVLAALSYQFEAGSPRGRNSNTL